jgi:hypothetical protein
MLHRTVITYDAPARLRNATACFAARRREIKPIEIALPWC